MTTIKAIYDKCTLTLYLLLKKKTENYSFKIKKKDNEADFCLFYSTYYYKSYEFRQEKWNKK